MSQMWAVVLNIWSLKHISRCRQKIWITFYFPEKPDVDNLTWLSLSAKEGKFDILAFISLLNLPTYRNRTKKNEVTT